jgi:Flp pilus assembly protein TadG
MQKTRKQNGQALVEMASILPLLSIILLGCLDLGRAFHVHMAAANAAHVGLMYAQQVTDPTTSPPKTITVADVINKTVNAAQGSIPIPLANADSYVKVDVEALDGSVSSSLTTMVGVSQTITVTVTDPYFKPITPFVHLATVGGSASGRALP